MGKKILHILSSNSFSGAENVAINIITGLSQEIEAAYSSPVGSIEGSLSANCISYLSMSQLTKNEIKRVVETYQPTIIHAHDFTASILCVLALLKQPIVSHIHQNPAWLKGINFKSLVYFMACIKISRIIVVTPTIIEGGLLARLFLKKIVVLSNAGDLKKIRIRASEESLEHYDIAFIGRLCEVKDPLRFLEIICILRKRLPGIRAVLIGEGGLRTECEKIIRENGMENCVEMTGHLSNPLPVLKKSKLLVMTSKYEGLPIIIIEALTLGKPVIVPDIPSMQSIIDVQYGRICNRNIDFVNSIINLLSNPDLYNKMSQSAMAHADHSYNLKEYCARLLQIYNKLS